MFAQLYRFSGGGFAQEVEFRVGFVVSGCCRKVCGNFEGSVHGLAAGFIIVDIGDNPEKGSHQRTLAFLTTRNGFFFLFFSAAG